MSVILHGQGPVSTYRDMISASPESTLVNDITTSNRLLNNNEDIPILWWQHFLEYSQLCLVIMGILTNVATVITLYSNGQAFSPAILILLRHQSAADAATCLFSAILIIQPKQPHMTGVYFIDLLVCHLWHSQTMFWCSLLLSIWNLVFLAFERYLAVRHPFKHQDLTPKRVRLMLTGAYIWVAMIQWPNYFLAQLSGGFCEIVTFQQHGFWLTIQYWFALSAFFAYYIIPCTLFVILYGMVILTLYARQRQSHLTASRVIDKASSELTKTALVVTLILIVTMGLNMWYFMLGSVRVINIAVYSPIHMISLWLASLNSTANPFVYTLLMPAYRKSVQRTFCFCLHGGESDQLDRNTSTQVSCSG